MIRVSVFCFRFSTAASMLAISAEWRSSAHTLRFETEIVYNGTTLSSAVFGHNGTK